LLDGTAEVLMKIASIRTLILALALALGCGAPEPSDPAGGGGGAVGGKADGETCELRGSFAASGDFQSFSRWEFTFEEGVLTDSHTDDLPAEEWRTTVVQDDDASRVSLIQITHASDAILEVALHMEIDACDADGVSLSPVAAYTTTIDETSAGSHDVDVHEVIVEAITPPAPEGPQAEVDARVAAILEEYDLRGLTVEVDAEELARQEALGNAVDFETALRKALDSFLTDGEDLESPVALVTEDLGNSDWECLDTDDATAAVRCFMQTGTLRLLTLDQSPEWGEDTTEFWVFSLYMGSLSDHGHWAVIDRNDARAPVYNYGFN
jgi:hypothetical protein